MTFEIEIGHASRRGSAHEVNEDFAGAQHSAPGDAVTGVIAAIADGVSTGGHGAEAAQTSVMGLLADFFATPATWETTVALDRLIGAQNGWLVAQNRRRTGAALTTLSALVLQGQGWTVAHVGDTRIWRIAGGQLQLLTQDHAFAQPDLRHRLTRAVGLDDGLRTDYLQGEAQVGDVFVLTTDGVHGALKPQRLGELARAGGAQQASEAIVEAAIAAGSPDDATALVIRVLGLDAARLGDETARQKLLPALPALKVGQAVDGFTITARIADNGVHRLYQARTAGGELVALKTLHESRAADGEERAMLAHEAWLAMRITERDAAGFVRARPVPEATALYAVFDWHAGRTLGQMLADAGRRFTAAEVVAGAIAIGRALGRLHRQGVIHRDITPANLHLGDDGQWRILDLGVALSGRESEAVRALHAGTPSYINPEQWRGERADSGSDLFALGVVVYRWLTGRLPYGEIEPYQIGRYRRDPVPPSRLRPDVPIWLDQCVLKAIAIERRQRFETAEELVVALERGASRQLEARAPTPLAARDPVAPWKVALGISLLFNALLAFWLLFLPH